MPALLPAQTPMNVRPVVLSSEIRTTIPIDSSVDVNVATAYGTAMLYEVRLPSVGDVTLKAYDSGANVYVPLDAILQLVGVRYRAAGVHETISINGKSVVLDSAMLAGIDGGTYVQLTAFGRVLGVVPALDRERAVIILNDGDGLPAARRAARLRARTALSHTEGQEEVGNLDGATLFSHASATRWGGLSLDYGVVSQHTDGGSLTGYTVGAATGVAGGSLVAQMNGFGTRFRGDLSWRRVWGAGDAITQLRIGEGISSGLGAVRSRGISITNAPYTRPMLLSTLPLTGSLPPGWNVDVYRDGALVGYDSISQDGRYAISVPVQYGENPFTVTGYGPFGATRQITRVIRMMPGMLPVARLEYAASAGPCAAGACSWTSNADFRYGVTSFLTVRGGATGYGWRDDSRTTISPYVGVVGRLVQGLGLSMDVMRNTFHRTTLTFDPWVGANLFAEVTEYANTSTGAMMGGSIGQRQLIAGGHIAPAPFGILVPALDAQLFRTRTAIGVVSTFRIASTVRVPGATIRPYTQATNTYGDRTVNVGAETTVVPSSSLFFGHVPVWLRGTVEGGDRGWSFAEVTIARPMFSQRIQTELGLRWQQAVSGPRIVLGLTSNLAAARVSTSAITVPGGNGGRSVTQSVSGSLRWDQATNRVVPLSDPILDRAGITGTVFLDRNGNGKRDRGEPGIPNVRVHINGASCVTDRRGRYAVWGVAVMDDVPVSVDTATLQSPWWAPRFNRIMVSAAPDHATEVPVPIVTGGTLEGQLVVKDRNAAALLPLIATHIATGMRRNIPVFEDGGFYATGMLPGRYILSIDPAALHALALEASPINVDILPAHTTGSVRVSVTSRAGTTVSPPSNRL